LDAYFFLWFFSACATAQLFARPYDNPRHNLIDGIGLLSILVSGNMGLVYNIIMDDTAAEILTITLIAIQGLTYMVFIGEVLRLLFWKPYQERRRDRLKDHEDEVGESTVEMKRRLEREERIIEDARAPKQQAKTFGDLMQDRRIRTLGEQAVESLRRKGQSEASFRKGTTNDVPLSKEELFNQRRIERNQATEGEFEEVEEISFRPVRDALYGDPDELRAVNPHPEEFEADQSRNGEGGRSGTNPRLQELERDIDRFLGAEERPLYVRHSSRAAMARRGATVPLRVSRPVELEARHKEYLAGLERERAELTRKNMAEFYPPAPTFEGSSAPPIPHQEEDWGALPLPTNIGQALPAIPISGDDTRRAFSTFDEDDL
jgi:hypothetical protein